ncbi:GAF and ANTAR domain-containing protein [Sporichthya sp.]|uniref:GAF and ANTAR domain-containing protein n=1 Tax=Sporichthya sp. TaxID=65475 RepID=UPI0017F3CA03|nr:GAF and ANTAR domain-containing protein [Sporichthya sp.]MBA3742206.1 GAF and ANTAR domain-containing protein [Sporichthya sp.]
MAELSSGGAESSARLCQAARDAVGMSGAGVMLMSGDLPAGSLCTSGEVSNLIEELQFTLGEGPCVDAHQKGRVVSEPDLADPQEPRWLAFTARAVPEGVRAIFGFPVTVGAARIGALNLYRDSPGPLSDAQHADALVMAQVIATWVLDVQGAAAPGMLADAIDHGGDFYFLVHNAAGAVSVQLDVSVTEALIRLRAYAFANNRSLLEVAQDVVARKLRF